MITDPSNRYVVCQTDGQLVTHDRRWRRRKSVVLPPKAKVVEGRSALMVIVDGPDSISVEVRRASDITTVVASGVYQNWQWTFEGDKSAFAEVPEYFVLPRPDGNVLLRIADGAVLTLLDDAQGLADMTTVVAVPDSRLVVLSDGAQWAIYDPKTTQGGYHSELAEPGLTSHVAFAPDGTAMFLCDRTSVLKLNTKAWTVDDAAGTEPANEPALPITAWDLEPATGRLLIAHQSGEVFAIDCQTMAAEGVAFFESAPIGVRVSGDKVLAANSEGRLHRRALRRQEAQVTPASNSSQ